MYNVIKCPNCKTYQLSTALKVFKCINCQKTKNVSKIRIIFSSQTPGDANNVLKEIKKENFKLKSNSDDNLDEFKSAI